MDERADVYVMASVQMWARATDMVLAYVNYCVGFGDGKK